MSETITYELPLSERIRTFLRLQHLFQQMQYFSLHDDEHHNRAELNCLLDILVIAGRSDLKNEIIKEIERHTKSFAIFSQNPHVDGAKLQQSINQLKQLSLNLFSSTGRTDQKLGQVELLKCLAQRSSIPGGAYDFDLPAYHFWLNRPLQERREQIQNWCENLIPIQQSINLLLQFIRTSTTPMAKTAQAGFYQQNLDANHSAQLLRVSFEQSKNYYAEISGGKHRFTVRFMQANESERATQVTDDINFTLNICQL
ncbi:MAG: cell division protein ZapD [Cycloclasticus sp.]